MVQALCTTRCYPASRNNKKKSRNTYWRISSRSNWITCSREGSGAGPEVYIWVVFTISPPPSRTAHTPQCLQAFANTVLCAWKTSSSISNCYLPLKVKLPLGRMNPSLTILNSEYFADNSIIECVKYCSYLLALQLDPELHQAGLDLNYIHISRSKLCDGVQFMCSQKCREDTNLKFLFSRVHFKSTLYLKINIASTVKQLIEYIEYCTFKSSGRGQTMYH